MGGAPRRKRRKQGEQEKDQGGTADGSTEIPAAGTVKVTLLIAEGPDVLLPIVDFGLGNMKDTQRARLCNMERVSAGQCFASSLRKRRRRKGRKGKDQEEKGGGKEKVGRSLGKALATL